MDVCTHSESCLELDLPAEPESVAVARHAVLELAARQDFSEATLKAVGLAVSEAASNVVLHAYHDQPSGGPLLVQAEVDEDDLCVRVCDEGPGVRPRLDSPGLGLGMPLIVALASHMEVVRDAAGRNCVCMWFGSAPGPTSLWTNAGARHVGRALGGIRRATDHAVQAVAQMAGSAPAIT
jgi:serine/threonine-protein kinase RsbW/stage II sporulation protein AB (anti-sigma F factor)